MMIRATAAVALAVLFTSCAGLNFDAPDQEFGPRPSAAELQVAAKAHFDKVMFDPESKRERWIDQEPRRAACWRGLIGGGWNHGWGMRLGLNGKNRFGGYVGEKQYFVIRSGGVVYIGEEMMDNFKVDDRPASPGR